VVVVVVVLMLVTMGAGVSVKKKGFVCWWTSGAKVVVDDSCKPILDVILGV
jgi:hypothetical protein